MTLRLLLLLAVMPFFMAARADWPQWRGPTGKGQSDQSLPVKWHVKTGENVLWKAPLPNSDNPYSSPIVSGDRIFVTLTMNKTREHHVLAFDKSTGKPLWDVTVDPGPWTLTDLRGGYAAPTPCADADRLYVLFGSAVLAALNPA